MAKKKKKVKVPVSQNRREILLILHWGSFSFPSKDSSVSMLLLVLFQLY